MARMQEIVVELEDGTVIYDDPMGRHMPAVDSAKDATKSGFRCFIVMRYVDDLAPAYFVNQKGDRTCCKFWFEPRIKKERQDRPELVGPRRRVGRPRTIAAMGETVTVTVVLSVAERDAAMIAGGGVLSNGIRAAIALLPAT